MLEQTPLSGLGADSDDVSVMAYVLAHFGFGVWRTKCYIVSATIEGPRGEVCRESR